MTRKKLFTSTKVFVVCASVGLTLLVVVILANLAGGEKVAHRKPTRLYSVQDPAFARALGLALGPSIVEGNKAETLLNGDEIFSPMLEAIRGAQKTITMETFIYWAGDTGRTFAEALAERSRAGVKVHVLIDWVGSSKVGASDVAMMKTAGVDFQRFRPLRWYSLGRLNHRTHRKLLVVDGRIGFTGGVGIADAWTGHAQAPEHWRDSHFRVEGPAVAQLQAAFMDSWIKTTGEVLHGDDYFPPLEPAGPMAAQVFISSPSGGGESMELMYLLAITAAQKSIYLSNAYFLPDTLILEALTDALKRGVRVQIITPGKLIDQKIVRRASRAHWGELLAAGAEMYEYEPTMYHCKVLIVDELLASVGSTNFDPRSFLLNDEANLNVYDAAFAQRQEEVFRQDLTSSHRVTLAEWRARPLREKLLERLATLVERAL